MTAQLALFTATVTPDPGSPEARQLGCKCPNVGNYQAGMRGYAGVHPDQGWDHTEWVVSTACKLHWRPL